MPKASEIVKSPIFDPPGGKLCAGLRPAPKGGGGSKGWLYNLRRLWHLEIVAGGPAALPIPNATGPPRITGRLNDTLPFVEFFPTSAFNCQLIEGGWSRPSRYNLLFSEFFSTRIFFPKIFFQVTGRLTWWITWHVTQICWPVTRPFGKWWGGKYFPW